MPRTRSITDNTILDTAINIIGNDGIDALTFARLSERTNLAPPTLIQRFHTKEELLFCVAKHCMTSTDAIFADARQQSESPLGILLHAFASLASSIQSPEHFANGLALLQLSLKDSQLATILRTNASNTRAHVAQLLDEAVAANEISPCDTATLALSIQNTFEGATTTWSIYRQDEVTEWVLNQLEQIIKPYRK